LTLPPLDCHAHIDPTVTKGQVATLDGGHIFAMTRSIAEATLALTNSQDNVHWSVGAHPGLKSALDDWDSDDFVKLLASTFLVGEIGLDRRGSRDQQLAILEQVLALSSGKLVSVHSSGRSSETVRVLSANPRPGVILHWFTGSTDEATTAAELGCYFSINAAMDPLQMRKLPLERVLPETDFPFARARTGATKPGDTRKLDAIVAGLVRKSLADVRLGWYQNLDRLVRQAGAGMTLPESLRATLAEVRTGG